LEPVSQAINYKQHQIETLQSAIKCLQQATILHSIAFLYHD